MRHLLKSALLATAIVASLPLQALAQQACTPDKLAQAVDVYSSAPFGARAWRVLSGLGDPGLDANGDALASWESNDGWRKRVSEVAPDMPALQDISFDCRMRYPLEVLNQRVATHGKDSAYVKGWLRGQERVIAACSGKQVPDAQPLEAGVLKPGEEAAFKDDAAYQDASILFYTNKTEAVARFKAIGASTSVHKGAARYNVANLLANGKDLAGARAEAKAILADASLASVHGITKELLGYISNLEDTPEGWADLLQNTVATLTQPASAIKPGEDSGRAYAQALFDIEFAGVTEKRDDWFITNTLPENPTLSKALADAARKEPMVLWMMTGQTVAAPYSRAPWNMVGSKWKAWATSFVDRAGALQPAGAAMPPLAKQALDALKAGEDDASRAALWASAADLAAKANADCGTAPETAVLGGVLLNAVRVSAQAGRYDEITAGLKRLPLPLNSATLRDIVLPRVMATLIASGKVEEGRKLRDELGLEAFAAKLSDDFSGTRDSYAAFLRALAEDKGRWLAANAIAQQKLAAPELNFLPAKQLRALSEDASFSADQKALLLRAAFTRNYARGISQSDASLDAMLSANPEVKAALDGVRQQFPKLRKDRALLLTILRNPRFGILVNSPDWSEPIETKRTNFAEIDSYDHNDKNWWCPLQTDRLLGSARNQLDQLATLSGLRDYDAKRMALLLDDGALAKADTGLDAVLRQNAMFKLTDWAEAKALANVPSAPKLLAQSAIRWAKASDGQDGAPEALALAVRATRYGCSWHGGHKAWSKPAQELLKAKFASSEWAIKTPYWFDCMDRTWNDKGELETTCKPRSWPKQPLPK